MRIINTLALAGTMAIAATSAAAAQSTTFTDAEACIAAIGELDLNRDGYVDNHEASSFKRVETNIDVNRDGWISEEEKVVACEDGVERAFVPHSEG